MKIYLVVNDSPADYGDHEIISAHLMRANANKRLLKYQTVDAYGAQYYKVKPIKVEP